MWSGGLGDEIEFWQKFLATGGLGWPEDFARRVDRTTLLQGSIARLLPPHGPVRVLDVGAGPLTVLGSRLHDRELEIVATDALADEYDRLLAEHDIDPPVRTQRCDAERLTERFAPDSFHLAHARNTLDHAYDPAAAIGQMLAVVRPGGHVVLVHHENEGDHEDYEGLHQWNLTLRDDRLVVWRPGEVADVDARLVGLAERTETVIDDEGWMRVVYRKRSDGLEPTPG